MLNDQNLLDLQKAYEEEPIPKELSQRVAEAVYKAERELLQEEERERILRGKKMKRRVISAAAAMVVVVGGFGLGVNTSKAFADTVSDIPVLSSLAKVFTVERIHEENDTYVADLNIPGIEGLKDKALQQRINNLVRQQVTAAVEETKAMMEENKKAYLETGGTEEDYMKREISVDYNVQCLNDKVLSFSVYKTETLASAYFDMFYYNYDLETGKELTLKDLLGDDYKDIANKQIKEQIAERAKEPGAMYWDTMEDMEADAFKTIADDQQFYINQAGKPVIVFNKYEIAPGYMGIQEFEIQK
ncbi:DUF3298 and DUF4163 domain-containing protein [Aminipila butyrica]|uniref:DUF3298 and DUF4163 domain-containing protein n=1 Tax=Aminipila butyrica TaxID=433296 RepID=A0A858BWT6_9FIRM|nr:DUF3298 and DUF4163 domain-containing protein [Aminipila butyrica]QIB69639.1 DUF3298 and DUF4163 domain-containing protein [Aminipila butyrica]